ncbi:phosphoribosylformimino-5-aminoimidazole carboxamide ribotide isomerase [Gracilibacillus kekensis]|uniref:1-(5-phosphoribosyl)-5-[(5-phosphoribosylamino)methylideneamino] imidazole-4-carboxamide isomerase n=1 Tax=Gracilibacillus kekensis TaxID=1027249 RepID=A0A1M7PYN3_9BACI|nr:phosphoribosylformimino-5-aminoimidazole carboxamide ribotide isomerase [Gracilibacillus kekensis]SHN22858.1 1-(5-phosphoribosyl)-5-[(5-phosphoribosylamino)methylideneamino] imidazole-4-carboxamide isomerase [Gracilibacillus kekensis]
MEFRPCIDLHQGKVKQIVGATLNNENQEVIENYVSTYDSIYYAEMFKEDKLKGGHVIMLGEGNKEAAIKALQTYPGGLQVGGGINADNADEFLAAGASHVIVTSYIFHDGELKMDRLQRLVDKIGKEKLVIDLSCKQKDGKWYVVTDKWTRFSKIEITPENIKKLERYCDEFLIHAADVEGKRGGIAGNLVEILADAVSIPVTYAGGVSSIEDLQLFETLSKGNLNVTIGSALDIFGGDLSYDQVVEHCK